MLARPMRMKPGAAQASDGWRIGGRGRTVAQCARAGARHLPLDVGEILDRDGNARIRRRRGIGGAQLVDTVGGGARLIGVDADERARAFAGGVLDPRKAFLDEGAGRRLAAGEFLREPGKCRMAKRHLKCPALWFWWIVFGIPRDRKACVPVVDAPRIVSASWQVCGIPWCSARSFFGQDLVGDAEHKIMFAATCRYAGGGLAYGIPACHPRSNTTLPT